MGLGKFVSFLILALLVLTCIPTVFCVSEDWIEVANSYSAIHVLKDNIVIDGANFSLIAQNSTSLGIDLSERKNVTVKNFKIRGFKQGIFLSHSSDDTIYGNEIMGFSGEGPAGVPTGIWFSASKNNHVECNNILQT